MPKIIGLEATCRVYFRGGAPYYLSLIGRRLRLIDETQFKTVEKMTFLSSFFFSPSIHLSTIELDLSSLSRAKLTEKKTLQLLDLTKKSAQSAINYPNVNQIYLISIISESDFRVAINKLEREQDFTLSLFLWLF